MGGGWLCPGEQEAAAEISSSGEGLGAWESKARGEKRLLAQRRVCRGRRTSGALSAGSCFLSAPSSSAPAQLAAGGTPSPPSFLQPEGLSAQSLAALNAPCVVCAHQMLHLRRCCQTPRGCDPSAAPTQSPAPKNTHREQGTSRKGEGGGDVRVWGLAVPSQPGPVCHTGHRSRLSRLLCTAHAPLALLGLGAEDRPRSGISCPLCHVERGRGGKGIRDGRGGFSGMLQGMEMVRERCSVCGCCLAVSKGLLNPTASFCTVSRAGLWGRGMPQELGRTAREGFQPRRS